MTTINVNISNSQLAKLTEFDVNRECESVNDGIVFIDRFRSQMVDKPIQPRLKSKSPTQEEMDKYQKDNEKYLNDIQSYNTRKENYYEREMIINNLKRTWISDQANLKSVPEQYRDKVWNHAWRDGHSYGYYEVYNKLVSLVEIFE